MTLKVDFYNQDYIGKIQSCNPERLKLRNRDC